MLEEKTQKSEKQEQKQNSDIENGARVINYGLKRKDRDDGIGIALCLLILVVSIAAAYYIHWIVGLILFIVPLIFLLRWYFKK